LTRTKIRTIEKDLKASGRFEVTLIWGRRMVRLSLRRRRKGSGGDQHCDNCTTTKSVHLNGSQRSPATAVLHDPEIFRRGGYKENAPSVCPQAKIGRRVGDERD
ncbi:MAG: hypothetical protein DME94_01625, partial [Verrucomicrobia bacterium]